MNIYDFEVQHGITSTIELKDGRKIHTTSNGFRYWVESRKGKVDEITEALYNKAKQHRLTKKNQR